MTRLDTAVRLAGLLLALSLSLAALAFAWAMTTRTTPATAGAYPAVYRENLATRQAEFCLLGTDGVIRCFDDSPAAPSRPGQ